MAARRAQVRAAFKRGVVAGTNARQARKRCSHVAFSCDEKHTDLELVILTDYQLFSASLTLAFRSGVQNSAVLVGLAGDRLAFNHDNQETRASCLAARWSH